MLSAEIVEINSRLSGLQTTLKAFQRHLGYRQFTSSLQTNIEEKRESGNVVIAFYVTRQTVEISLLR